MNDIEKDIVHLAQLALNGKQADLKAYLRKIMAPILKRRPDLASFAKDLTSYLIAENNGIRHAVASEILPVDIDSRQELLRREPLPELPSSITWPESVELTLAEIIKERDHQDTLTQAGLSPSKSLLFVGPPGVGKTLAARWIAREVSRPLLTLDLAAVMSSYLGKTGNNIRAVLDFAKRSPSVLLLDEFDAIAKKRDDDSEVGELKRLVTVLLQSIDDWPSNGILIAATNHPELLDPAVWRRFDRIIEFPKPKEEIRVRFIQKILDSHNPTQDMENESTYILSALFADKSFAEIKREVDSLRKKTFLHNLSLQETIMQFIEAQIKDAHFNMKLDWARILTSYGLTQYKIRSLTGLSRDTIRKHCKTQTARITTE
jgi:SpoVK/Ycf46/Vps4 family AAA+-type ATPase